MRILRVFAAPMLLCVMSSFAGAQEPAGGAAVYAANCARCHDASMPTVPSREAIAAYLPERVETALSTFVMRAHGEGLSHQQRRAVAEFVTGSPPGTLRDPLEVIPADAWCARVSNVANPLAGAAWNGWGAGADNRRFQSAAAAGLSRADVPRLRLRWAFAAPGVVDSGSQATVVGARVFFGTRNGMVYSLDTRSG
ncbi:MAG: PQQ-binding-like beta-propeller repeat protein, partial [Gammaproteobacteria bacterium]